MPQFYNIITSIFRSKPLQVAEYIAECARILEKSGLKYQVRVTVYMVH